MGKRGGGKSYLLSRLVRSCRRIIVFDTVCQFKPSDLPGFTLVTQPGKLVAFLRQHGRGDFKVVYRGEHHPEQHFSHVASLVAAVGEMVFAVDEIDYFGTAGACDEKLDWLIRYGRHRRVAMVYTARRPAEVPRNLTAQTSEFRIFRLTEPRDLEYMTRLIGPAAARVPQLAQFEHLRWLDSGGCWRVDARGRAFSE